MSPRNNIILWLILSLLLGYGIYSAVKHYDHSPYNDLRNRVVGARLMAAQQSPYFHKWQPGEPETWLDPFEKQDQIVNGNTVTPPTLAVFSWMNGMHYDQVKWLWIVLTFACFVIALALIARLLKLHQRPRYLLLLPAALLASAAWKLHVYSGQVYIVYAMLLIVFFYLFTIKQIFPAALTAVLLIAMRPPAVLLFLPLLLWKFDKRMLYGGLAALLLLGLVHIVKIPSGTWTDYFRSMKIHALEIPGKIPGIANPQPIPHGPENIRLNIAEQEAYQKALSPDILSVQKILPEEGFLSETYVLPLMLTVVYIILFLFTVKRKPLKKMNTAGLLLFGFVLYILSEYFLPAPRFTYNFVQWLFPLAVLTCSGKLYLDWRLLWLLWGLFMNMVKLSFIPDAYSVGELMMLTAVLGYIFLPGKTGDNNGATGKAQPRLQAHV